MAFTIEELNRFNVHELRARAREVGVRAPTTKKQQELIAEILKIQTGELKPHSTNMGRPVKTGIRAEILKNSNTLSKDAYSRVDVMLCGDKFHDCADIYNAVECAGIVRKCDGKYYIQNYLEGCKYVIIFNKQVEENMLNEGDFIKGKATVVDNIFGELIMVDSVNFEKHNNNLNKEIKVITLKNEQEIYSYIQQDSKINKIVLEIESNKNLPEIFNGSVVIKTKECEDVKVTFNALMDCKKFIQNLCSNNIDFILYINNTEYIYSILTVYYNYINMDQDLNAGQYFKEILSMVANSSNGNVVLFEKEKGRRSSYLDIIINRYCE